MTRYKQVKTILALRAAINKAYDRMGISDSAVNWQSFRAIRDDINALPIMRTELARAIKTGACYPGAIQSRMREMTDQEYTRVVALCTRTYKGLTRDQVNRRGF